MNNEIKLLMVISILVVFVSIFSILIFFMIYPVMYKDLIIKYANQYNLSPTLVASVINCESNYDKNAISHSGAIGLMQLMPNTALYLADINNMSLDIQNLFLPETNIMLGCFYLQKLNKMFNNDLITVLSAYNAGPQKVSIWLNDINCSTDTKTLCNIPYKETSNYVNKIIKNIGIYSKFYQLKS